MYIEINVYDNQKNAVITRTIKNRKGEIKVTARSTMLSHVGMRRGNRSQ